MALRLAKPGMISPQNQKADADNCFALIGARQCVVT